MPGQGNPIIVGGGISAGTPFALDGFLKVSSVSPPAANSSARLIERATSIEILGDGTTSTSIGNGADANGPDSIALGTNVITSAVNTDQYAIGKTWSLANSQQLAIGSPQTGAATYNGASSWVGIGSQQSYTALPSNSVFIGAGLSGGGNSAVGIGAAVGVTGNGGVAVGANASAGLNSISIGQLATTGNGGSRNNISIGASCTGPAGTNGVIQLGNRAGGSGTVTAGDILLGHQDNSNNVFSLQLILGGGPEHKASTAVPAFTVRGRQAQGTDLAAGQLTFVPLKASGTGLSGGIALQSQTPTTTGTAIGAVADAFRVDPRGNITLAAAAGSYGGGVSVTFIGNAGTVPSSNPTGGGILYCEAGALKYRGSGGTVTVLGPA